MTSQFSDMMSSSNFWPYFVSLVKFSFSSKFHVNIITGPGVTTIFFYKEYPRLSFAKYLQAGESYGYQIWHKCLQWKVTECCKIPGLQILPFLSYYGKPTVEGGGDIKRVLLLVISPPMKLINRDNNNI